MSNNAAGVQFPRRSCLKTMIPAERAIYNAIYEIEMLGADERLTNAIIKLDEARKLVADFVDAVSYPTLGELAG